MSRPPYGQPTGAEASASGLRVETNVSDAHLGKRQEFVPACAREINEGVELKDSHDCDAPGHSCRLQSSKTNVKTCQRSQKGQ